MPRPRKAKPPKTEVVQVRCDATARREWEAAAEQHLGRVNKGDWDGIREHWLDLYLNREEEDGLSVMRTVSAEDEWCAKAYIGTNYGGLTRDTYEDAVKRYLAFRLFNRAAIPEAAQ